MSLGGKNPFLPNGDARPALGSHCNSINIECLLCACLGARDSGVVSGHKEKQDSLPQCLTGVKGWRPGASLASGTGCSCLHLVSHLGHSCFPSFAHSTER